MRKITAPLLSLSLLTAILLGCTDTGNPPNANSAQAARTNESGHQADDIVGLNDVQIQEAMKAAAKYLKTQYTVEDIYDEDEETAQLKQIQQKIKTLLTPEYYEWVRKERSAGFPLQIAIQEKTSITPKDITIRSRTVSNTDQMIRLSYRLDLHLDKPNKSIPLGGKLIMQNENGNWKIASDYNNADSLREWNGVPSGH
ncbi:hypothetical protein [Paenibacillus wulumuqiensis]|uniref:hypothetical protein n=1 Tax=Paenibacillus wulumuqiensis TaxID=1567107 RepID=UPI000619A865|nr:hypothetical protein [Paenibacillus wulumuqiensis]